MPEANLNQNQYSPPPLVPEDELGAATEMGSSQARDRRNDGADEEEPEMSREENEPETKSTEGKVKTNEDARQIEAEYRSNSLRELLNQKFSYQKELDDLDQQVDGMIKFSGSLRVIRYIPKIGAQIRSIQTSIKNAKGKAKVAKLQTILAALNTIKVLLTTARMGAGFIEAVRILAALFISTLGTIVIPILIVILAIPIIIVMTILPVGPLSRRITELIQKVDKMISDVKPMLDREKKRVNLRNKIKYLDRAIASQNK